MMNHRISRRNFMASTTLIGAAGLMLPYASSAYAASGKTLNVRMDRDIDILDPGYMVGGSEIDVQQAVEDIGGAGPVINTVEMSLRRFESATLQDLGFVES